eukprot:50320-Pelagomonas_calceolata.AAC.2
MYARCLSWSSCFFCLLLGTARRPGLLPEVSAACTPIAFASACPQLSSHRPSTSRTRQVAPPLVTQITSNQNKRV